MIIKMNYSFWILTVPFAVCCLLSRPVFGARPLKIEHKVFSRTASPTPLNIELDKDCALKELAWTYAKKVLPQV